MPEAHPGQTVGPFFHVGLPYGRDRELVPPGTPGALLLHGHVLDGAGQGVPDALVEIRQADAAGAVPRVSGSLRRDPVPFTGWGRAATDRTGHWWFRTVEPGPARPGTAVFFAVTVFARGLTDRLFTRCYVPGDGIAADPLLASLTDAERAGLLATRDADGGLRFDIRLQGEQETVFLAFPRHRD